MGWDDVQGGGGRATPPRSATPPRMVTAAQAGFGGDMPIVMGTVVTAGSPTGGRARLSRAGDDLSDMAEFGGGLGAMRQPRPSDLALPAEAVRDVRVCGSYVSRGRVCGLGIGFVALLGAVIVVAALGGGDDDLAAAPPTTDGWSYDTIPTASEIPTSSPHVELELSGDLSAMPEGSAERREFEGALINDAATVMGISRTRIAVLDIRAAGARRRLRRQLQAPAAGLLLVTLGIVPSAAGERSAGTAVADLAAAITIGTGTLPGLLSGARITASGNMLGEVGQVQLSQVLPCNRYEAPDANGNTCSMFVQGAFYDCMTLMVVYGYDCVCSCDAATYQPLPVVQWTRIDLSSDYTKPVVVVSPVTFADSGDAHVRVRKVSGSSFELALQESSCLDQRHFAETVSWMVVEAGSWHLGVATPTFEADTVPIAPGLRKDRWERVALSERLQVPVVISHLMTSNEGHTSSWSRLAHLDSTGFDIALEETSWDGHHAAELCGWIAFEAGSTDAGAFSFAAGRSNIVGGTLNPTAFAFGQSFSSAPVVFASVVSTHACCSDLGLRCDGDTSALRLRSVFNGRILIVYQEILISYEEILNSYQEILIYCQEILISY